MKDTKDLTGYVKYQLLKRKLEINDSSMGLLLPYGLGDTYLVCSLLSSYLKSNGLSTAILILKNGHEYIAKSFGFKKLVYIPDDFQKVIDLSAKYGSLKKGEIGIPHPNYVFNHYLPKMIGYKGLTLLDIYKIIFQLQPQTITARPMRTRQVSRRLVYTCKSSGMIKNRSVIIFPEANSVDMLSPKVWEVIAEHYRELGYKLYSSVINKENTVIGTSRIDIKLAEIVDVAEYAGTVVSLRSGICELLSTAKINLVVIYPKIPWYSGTLLEGSSLKLMGLSRTVSELEISRTINKTKLIRIMESL
jgi:hypothetical protein